MVTTVFVSECQVSEFGCQLMGWAETPLHEVSFLWIWAVGFKLQRAMNCLGTLLNAGSHQVWAEARGSAPVMPGEPALLVCRVRCVVRS